MLKGTAFRPAVDALEVRLTLSEMGQVPLAHATAGDVAQGGGADAASAMVHVPATSSRKAINGTLAGTAQKHPSIPDTGQEVDLSGSGQLKTLGAVQVSGSVRTAGFIKQGRSTGTLTLSNYQGSVTLALTGPSQPGNSLLPTSYSFTITGGTGTYRSLSGRGKLVASWQPSASSPEQFTFTVRSR